ncbi:MAG: hypothetical protein R3F62_22035 [Planctomycetota bacterium]
MERPASELPPQHAAAESPRVHHPKCPFCLTDVRGGELQPYGCPSCMSWSHLPCWEEHGSCPACGERTGAAPSPSRRPRAPQVRASERPAASGEREQPWWVGRTNHCTGCGDTFVVRNRYQRFKCPRCASGSPRTWLLAGVVMLFYLLLTVVLPMLLSAFQVG